MLLCSECARKQSSAGYLRVLISVNVGDMQSVQMHEESQALHLERISISSRGSPKTPQSMKRISQRTIGPSSPIGRPQSDVFSPSGRRSVGISGGMRALPDSKPQSDAPDLMRF